ncbi:MAG: amidohydrolase family protein [Spirochaetales bacterium]|jgi:5-methylthioadenosine/S-adenosylhomocysteine deaminase|nr:amidohydrolase family protein [Spirochaetales bacterium]
MLLKHGLVLTFEPDTLGGEIIPDGAVYIDGDIIADIGTTEALASKYPDADCIDAAGKVIMPGFIVAHTHMPYVLGHNQPVDYSQLQSFWDMLQKMGWEWLEDITTRDGIYAASRYAAMKMVKSGATTICDLVEGPNALPGPLASSVKAIDEIGIRAQLGYEVTERVPGKSILDALDPEMAEKGFEENLRFIHAVKGHSRISPRLGVHTAYTNTENTLRKARAFAEEHGCGIQIHIAEIPRAFLVEKYGKSAPQLLEETGLLGPDVLAAHCIDLTDEDMDILRRNDVKVAHTPMTNSLGGNGVARVPEMLEKGMTVALGHDCFFTLDTAEYMRYAYLVHKAHNANPMALPPFQLMDMVLMKGAAALGIADQVGSLKVGKKADILILNPDSPTPITAETVMSYFTMTFTGRDVETVLIDGNTVVENGNLCTADESEVASLCLEEGRKLWQRNGIEI